MPLDAVDALLRMAAAADTLRRTRQRKQGPPLPFDPATGHDPGTAGSGSVLADRHHDRGDGGGPETTEPIAAWPVADYESPEPGWLHRAIPDEFLYWPDGLDRHERLSLVYARARAAGRAAPDAADLLADPPALSALLGRAAVADPDLFHILLVHYTLVLAPIVAAGERGPWLTERRRELESMSCFGSALMTEGERSNSHLHPRTQARFDPATREFVLHTPDTDAVKFPNSTGHPDIPKTAAVYAQLIVSGTECGTFVFVVPVRGPDGSPTAGVEITPAPDTFALPCDFASVRFRGKRIPLDSWLADGASIDEAGRLHDPAASTGERLTRTMGGVAPQVWRGVIAASASTARASAQILYQRNASRLTMSRLAPELPLLRYRSQQEAMLDALASAHVLTAVARHSSKGDRSASTRSGEATWAPWSAVDNELALFKAMATRCALDTIGQCREHCGANGFITTNRLNAYHGFVHSYFSAGGENGLILLDTAHTMADPTTYRPPNPDPDPVTAAELVVPEACSRLSQASEHCLHRRLVGSLAEAARSGADEFTAWNDNLALAQAAATAHLDRLVVELLVREHATATPPVRALLRLYLLSWIERRAGMLADQLLTPPDVFNHIYRHRRILCDELLPQLPNLVAAIEFPDLYR
ncbi:acyl-CoA dehydrogenase [Nocardia sp. NPDC051570]|uniref:acyl-CoA dehydrogenase family protein n=1 Tax=Nocardia sp. NPDC051570 TaxID=3364324 RepID=UPI003794EBB7